MSSRNIDKLVGGAVVLAVRTQNMVDKGWIHFPGRRAEAIQRVLRTVFGLSLLGEAPESSSKINDEPLLEDGTIIGLRALQKQLVGADGARCPSYVIAHYRHLGLPESRVSITLLGEGARKRTWNAFHGSISGLSQDSSQELAELHEQFAAIYFGSIGRADAFTDALVRAVTWWYRLGNEPKADPEAGYQWPLQDVSVVRLCFSDEEESELVEITGPTDGTYTICVGKALAQQLRETGNSFRLNERFFSYVAKQYDDRNRSSSAESGAERVAPATDDIPISSQLPISQSAEEHVRALRDLGVLQTREALLEFVSHGAFHDNGLQDKLLRIHAALYPEADQQLAEQAGNVTYLFAEHVNRAVRDGNTPGFIPPTTFAKWRIAALRRVLAALQSASLFSETGDNDFLVYLRRPLTRGAKQLPGAIVLGGATLLHEHHREAISQMVESAFGELDRSLLPVEGTANRLAELCLHGSEHPQPNLASMSGQMQTALGDVQQSLIEPHETFDPATFWGGMYLGLQLVGRRHEGHPLQFRLAIGSDERLRQYFNIVHSVATPIEGNGGTSHLEIDLTESTTAENEIKRLGALLEANYPFLQDPGIFACCAVTALNPERGEDNSQESKLRPGLALRYLGVPNPRYRDLVTIYESSPWSDRFNRHTMERLSRSAREVLLVLCDAHGRGHALLEGSLAFAAEADRKRWVYRRRKSQDEVSLREELTSAAQEAVEFNSGAERIVTFLDDNDFAEKLCSIILDLSADPGAGAALAIGEESVIKEYMVSMTPVFEVSPGWKLRDFRTVDHFFDLAVQDGATAISIGKDERVFGRMHVKPVLNPEDRVYDFFHNEGEPPRVISSEQLKHSWLKLWQDQRSPYFWKDWGKWYKWGTRHRSAAALAYKAAGMMLVVCISQDGHIHLFNGYSIKPWPSESEAGVGSASAQNIGPAPSSRLRP